MKTIFLLILNYILFAQISVSQTIDLELDKRIQSSQFGYLYGLAVDSEQNIYISDILAGNIKLFSPKGELVTTIGGEGKGPGEFLVPKNISINNDVLYVYDDKLVRLSSFELKNSLKLKNTISIKKNGGIPDQVLVSNSGKKYSITTPTYTQANLNQKKEVEVSLIDQNGIVKKSFLKVLAPEYLTIRNGDGFAVGAMPFGRQPLFDVGNDDALYYANNNGIKFFKYSLDGKLVNEFSHKIDKRVLLQDEDWEKELERLRYDSDALQNFKKKTDKKYLPVFDWFVVDNQSRIWIAINTEDRENYRLLVLNQQGNSVSSMVLPSSTELKVIKDNYAFGIEKEGNTHSVIRYKILEI